MTEFKEKFLFSGYKYIDEIRIRTEFFDADGSHHAFYRHQAILVGQQYLLLVMSQRFNTDVLIIGGGAAGLSAALMLSQHVRVTVLCKGDITTGSSHLAQGGVAAVTDPEDSFEAHIKDTLDAGGVCATPMWFVPRSTPDRKRLLNLTNGASISIPTETLFT